MAEPSNGAPNDPEAQPAEADDGFVYRDPDTVPTALVQLAKQGGKGWVYEVDVTHVVRDRPISVSSVVGAWEVDEAGELSGWFAENEWRQGNASPAGSIGYTLQLWPHTLGSVPLDYSDRSVQFNDSLNGPWNRFFIKLEILLIWIEARWIKWATIVIVLLALVAMLGRAVNQR